MKDVREYIAWAFGILAILQAVAALLAESYISVIFLLGAAFIALPIAKPYRKKYGLEIGAEMKAIIWFILAFIAWSLG